MKGFSCKMRSFEPLYGPLFMKEDLSFTLFRELPEKRTPGFFGINRNFPA